MINLKKGLSEERKAEIVEKLNAAEDKGAAILECLEDLQLEYNEGLVNQIVAESQRASRDAAYKESLGLRQLSEKETKFYEVLKQGPNRFSQSVTADQIDIIPMETLDHTLDQVRSEYPILQLISFAPANVKHWLVASKSGTAAWGALTGSLTAELSATITGINIEVNKLHAYCVIPKAIRDLEIGYVDRYFTAILREAMYDGIVAGYLSGNGKTGPIGILKRIDNVNSSGEHTAKTKVATLTGFMPEQMAPVLVALSNSGARAVTGLTLIANPSDVYTYVNPALYGDTLSGGYVSKAFMPFEVIPEPGIAQGTAVFTMRGVYTMGFSGIQVAEYKETSALDDADLLVAKVYGNGRAVDDACAYVFDPTKLEKYIPNILTLTEDEGE
jgi:HK97 family phage major capsid protein